MNGNRHEKTINGKNIIWKNGAFVKHNTGEKLDNPLVIETDGKFWQSLSYFHENFKDDFKRSKNLFFKFLKNFKNVFKKLSKKLLKISIIKSPVKL